jgi:hypothetical protein
VIALVALVVATGGVGFAAIPDGDGTIHACSKNGTGALRVIDPSSRGACTERETSLRWKDGINGVVADSDRLDGKSSEDFLAATAAIDADTLDGKDAGEFVQEGDQAGGDLTGSYPAPAVAPNAITGSKVLNGSLSHAEFAVQERVFGFDPPPIAAHACQTVPLDDDPPAGVELGDFLVVQPGTTDNLVLAGARIVAPSSDPSDVRVDTRLCNATGTAVDVGPRTWFYLAIE